MIALKTGAKLAGLTPQMLLGIVVVQSVFLAHNADCTLTSVNDSTHGAKSKHYEGNAVDFRTKDYAGDKQALRDAVAKALGPDFDVVLEGLGTANEHLHVEYDPK